MNEFRFSMSLLSIVSAPESLLKQSSINFKVIEHPHCEQSINEMEFIFSFKTHRLNSLMMRKAII